MELLQTLFAQLTPTQWAGVGVLSLLAYRNLGSVMAGVSRLGSLVPRWGGSLDRKAALASYDDCIVYLESIGCDEGVNHLQAGLPHFYHKHEKE